MKRKDKKKEFVVFGLGRFGQSVATTLEDSGCEVLAVDQNQDRIQSMAEIVTRAVRADVTDKEALEALGIGNFDGAIIAIGENLEASVMATILVKELGIPYILAKAQSDIHAKVLKKIGADSIVLPEKEMGIRIANQLLLGNFFDAIELSTTFSIMEIDLPSDWEGKNIIQLDLRKKYKINVVAIKNKEEVNITPDPTKPLSRDDVLIIIGKNDVLNKLAAM